MAETKRALGRGLSMLLGESDPVTPSGSASASADSVSRETPIEMLRRNPDQPRSRFDEDELSELAASISEKGILQPLLVRPAPGAPGEFQIVAGERRWRAAQRAGLHTVPVMVRELSDSEVLEIGIVENVQRADLDAVEEATGYRALIDRFGHTQDVVAKMVGKSRSHVANALRLLSLPTAVRDHLVAGRLTSGHARAVAAAPDPERLAAQIVSRGMSGRQAAALARQAPRQTSKRPRLDSESGGVKNADVRALETDLAEMLGLTVELHDRGGSGELRLRYNSLEQLDEVCRRLMG